MFVGEQRFTEEFVTEFMELYRCSLEEKRYNDKLQTAKGGVIKINPGTKFAAMDEDPDDQQNQKLGGKPKEEEEEEEEDVDEEEDEEEDEDEDEEEEENEQEKPEEDHNVSKRSHMNTSRALLTEGVPIIRPVSRDLNARELKIRPTSKSSDITEMNKDSMNLMSNNMGDEEAEEEDEEISEEDEEEEEEQEEESPKSIKKADELSLNHSHSNASENIPVYSIEKTFKKQTSSKNFMKGDAPSIFNKSKIINNSTMRLDFDDHEEKLDYRL